MSLKTPIQWCDSAVNLVMGCDSCELWATLAKVRSALIALILRFLDMPRSDVRDQVSGIIERFDTSTDLLHDVNGGSIISELQGSFPDVPDSQWRDRICELFPCYAGQQHLNRGGTPENPDKPRVKGFAANFDRPEMFPGRMAEAAKWSDLAGEKRADAEWLDGLPRLIFVSDMGDALSKKIPFKFLKDEIIEAVTSANGRRHVWLWLTKRPARMAEFAVWLQTEFGITWPDNLVAMTSVTNRATRSRIEELRQVPAKLRGLSVEPLFESVDLDLQGIDWVICGGASGDYPKQFDLEWARSLKRQCESAGVAFFLKQLGAAPVEDGFPFPVSDPHGGKWRAWPEDLQVREFPEEFRSVTTTDQKP